MRVRPNRLAAAALAACLTAGAPVAAAEALAFLASVEDLPLAPGLVEQRGQELVFDTPGGRIVEAHAAGAASADSVRAFYAQALPELGWVRRGDSEYRRDGEVLRLEVSRRAGGVAVQFTLQPEH